MNFPGRLVGVLNARALALGALLSLVSFGFTSEWPQYRGANHNGIATDRLNTDWRGSVTNPIWRVPLTNSLGSLVVSGDRVFTLARRDVLGEEKEICVALNAASGAELWARVIDDASYPHGGVGTDDGPRSTPAVVGDSVFLLSSYLKVHRLNVTNGAVVWSKDLIDVYGGTVISWQNAASLVVENGLMFVNANCVTDTLVALRTSDGGEAWRSQNEGMTHSTPVMTTLQGVRQVIFATQSGLVSLNPANGAQLWRSSYPFGYGTSIGVSPVVHDDMIFICGAHSYGMRSMVVRVSVSNELWTATRLWSTNNPTAHWMTPVARDGFLYGQFGIQTFDSVNAQLKCVDMRTGAVRWSTNGFGRGATILWDNHLVTLTERGQLVLSRPVTNAYTELARFTAIAGYHDVTNKCWNAPAVAGGKLFVRSTAFVAAFDLSVPELRMDPPRFASATALDLSIRTANGVPVTSNLLSGLEVRATTNLSLALTQWIRLTNGFVITNGVARVPNLGVVHTQEFFMVAPPQQ